MRYKDYPDEHPCEGGHNLVSLMEYGQVVGVKCQYCGFATENPDSENPDIADPDEEC